MNDKDILRKLKLIRMGHPLTKRSSRVNRKLGKIYYQSMQVNYYYGMKTAKAAIEEPN